MNAIFLLLFFIVWNPFFCCNAQDTTTLSYAEIDSLLYLEYDKDNMEGCIQYMQLGRDKAKTAFGDMDTIYALYTSDLAYFYWQQKEYKKAEPLYLEAKKIRAKIWGVEHDDYGTTLNNLALLYKDIGDLEQAKSLYLEVKNIKEKAFGKNSTAYLSALNNLLLFYQELGNDLEVEKLYRETIDIRAKGVGKEHTDYIGSLSTLANFYIKLEQYYKAEPLLKESNSIIKKVQTDEHLDYVISLNALANLYVLMEEFLMAEKIYLEAKKACEKNRETENIEYYRTLNNLTKLYPLMQDYNKAESSNLQLLEIWQRILTKDNPNYIQTLNSLAHVYLKMSKLEQADTLFLEVKTLKEQVFGTTHYEYLSSLLNLAELYSKKGATYAQKQEKILLELVTTSSSITDKNNDLSLYLNNLAFYYYQQKNTNSAWNYLNQAIKNSTGQHIELQSTSLKTDSLETAFRASNNSLNSLKIAYDLLGLENKKEAQLKLINTADEILKKCASSKLRIKEKSQLLSKQSLWMQFSFQLKNHSQTEELFKAAEFNKNIDLQRAITNSEDASFATLSEDFLYNNKLADIQKHLKEDALLLEYIVGDSNVWVIQINQQKASIKTLKITKKELQKRVAILYNNLTNRQALKEYSEQAFWFYQNLVAPVVDTSYHQLIIITDKELIGLPFECFLTKESNASDFKNLSYLIKDFKISYQFSSRLWKMSKEQALTKKNASEKSKIYPQIWAMAADYTLQLDSAKTDWRLPLHQRWRGVLTPSITTQKEVQFLEKNYQGLFFYDKNASEKNYKEKAANYAIIHLSMQGVLNEKTASLFFSEDGDSLENNLLNTGEILHHKIDADLVVLSNLEAGKNSAGILALAQAFTFAGASSLIVSLWQVNDDMTTELMKILYQNLADGMPKDEALQQAKLSYLSQAEGALAHPAFWSSLILIGDESPIQITQKTTTWLYIIGIGLLFIIGILFTIKKKMSS